ncbi:MAG TPA: hypothetical protein VLJ59_10015 [Mycobacteriales bacterium]|nr:hypothetical protein [Mycobacteriales bacterium]
MLPPKAGLRGATRSIRPTVTGTARRFTQPYLRGSEMPAQRIPHGLPV